VPEMAFLKRFACPLQFLNHYILKNNLSECLEYHFPILLDCGDISRGSRPFKFDNTWLKADGFVGLMKQWWDSCSFQGTPSYVLACKLKALKQNLKIWNEEVFGNVERNKRKLFEELQAFDTIEGGRALVEELLKKTEIVNELERCSLLEEVSWRHKLRVMWLKEGDKCTKFFHSIPVYLRTPYAFNKTKFTSKKKVYNLSQIHWQERERERERERECVYSLKIKQH
jgi:hypothetical protein